MRIIVFLQNAWSPLYAGRTWPRQSWLRALARSRSGQRLKHLVEDWDECENTTPKVGAKPSSVLGPDKDHIMEVLHRRNPDVVIACGRQAEKALAATWIGPLLAVPHPAHRVVTNALYLKANGLLKDGFNKRLALRQRRGQIKVERIH